MEFDDDYKNWNFDLTTDDLFRRVKDDIDFAKNLKPKELISLIDYLEERMDKRDVENIYNTNWVQISKDSKTPLPPIEVAYERLIPNYKLHQFYYDLFKNLLKSNQNLMVNNSNNTQTELISPNETTEPEPPIGKITAGQKYYLLEKLGLFDNGLLKGNMIKIEDKQLLVSKLLGVNIRTARAFMNNDEKYIFDPNKKNEIDNLLKKIINSKG